MKTKQVTVEFEIDTDMNDDLIEENIKRAIKSVCLNNQNKLVVRVYKK